MIHAGDDPRTDFVIEAVAKLIEESWNAGTETRHGAGRREVRGMQG